MPATPFAEIQAALGREVRSRFPTAEPAESYGIQGWRLRRPVRVEWTHGTVDPNYAMVGLADRRQGPTLHVWNPLDYKGLGRDKARLEAAGFRVMVLPAVRPQGALSHGRRGRGPRPPGAGPCARHGPDAGLQDPTAAETRQAPKVQATGKGERVQGGRVTSFQQGKATPQAYPQT